MSDWIDYPAEVYAASDGWAATADPMPEKLTRFEWLGAEWIVAGHFDFPCCGVRVALVQRMNTLLDAWRGVGPCPKECNADTFTIEVSDA